MRVAVYRLWISQLNLHLVKEDGELRECFQSTLVLSEKTLEA